MNETIPALGRIERVDLRQIWASEAGQFTPWLASTANITLLSDAIQIDLEVEAQEKEVGPFRADILCKDTLTGNWVLIENQLERTDHTHLGQLITYAAGLKAVTIAWIAARFTEEHRAALDWLNEATHEGVRFFGLEVEAWRIGDSIPAARFNVISKPNDWSRQVSGGARRLEQGELTEARRLQLDFWTAFKAFADEHARRFRPTKPQAQNWITFAIGRTDFNLAAVANLWDSEAQSYDGHELRAELLITTERSRECLDRLRKDEAALEKEIGEPLLWHSPEGVKMQRAFLRRPVDLEDRDAWPEYHAWLTSRLDRLHEALQPRVKALDLTSL